MADKVKVGVLGVGALGRHHARLYKEIQGAELVGIYDSDIARAREIAAEIGTEVFENVADLAAKVDGLSIAVPTNFHHRVASDLLKMNKHLLIEKPITETIAEAEELLAEANKRHLVVSVGHVERFNPVISYLELKADNPRFIECHRMSPYPPPRPGMLPRGTEVSVVLDLMIHDIDMVLNLVKSKVESVDAVGIPVLSPTEDIANARITFANGCVANLTASRVTPEPLRKIRVFQRDCYISLDYMDRSGEVFTRAGVKISREEVPVEDHNALLKELEDFVAGIVHLRETGDMPKMKVSGEHGLAALRLADEIIRKIRITNPL